MLPISSRANSRYFLLLKKAGISQRRLIYTEMARNPTVMRMLARMPPGGVIPPHVDANPAARWPHKIHVPVSTNDKVVCWFGEQEHHFPQGEAVEVNNLGPHWVRNGGDTDRVHLIFEYYDPDQPEPGWLAPLVQAGAGR